KEFSLKYNVIASAATELTWVHNLMSELK
ncbi:hypothetical protein CCACVL1_00004, partial [Corchorus capsularis]